MTEDIAERFAHDTADHALTVLHDDGLYRHLRFKQKGTSGYWFDLITWPGNLAVRGDCGSFAFARIEDMFEFFRGHAVNPGYWAEKVTAADPSGVRRYSEELFRQQVTEEIAGAGDDFPGLAAAVESAFWGIWTDWDTASEEGAHTALAGFRFELHTATCAGCGEEASGLTYDAANSWRVAHRGHRGPGGEIPTSKPAAEFRFTDTWEWDLTDWNWWFLWCCHAIVWGIAQYDAQRAPAPVAAGSQP